MVLSSEEDNGCDNVGVIGNELLVKIHKAKEGAYSLDRGWRVPVKDARSIQTYSFLPASWAGDTHEETDFLPIGNREEKEKQLLDHRTDSSRGEASTCDKALADKNSRRQE